MRSERGQALPSVLGAAAVLVIAALVLAALGGAITGKGRAQRAADLAALSAARSMRDDLPRLLAPARLPSGAPNPRHLSKRLYLSRARDAAAEAARRNGVAAARLTVDFPDASSNPPLRARVRVRAEIDPDELPGGERVVADGDPGRKAPIRVEAIAVAEAGVPAAPAPGAWGG